MNSMIKTENIKVDNLYQKALDIRRQKGELLTVWGSDERPQNNGFILHLVFIFWETGALYLHCDLSLTDPSYPDLSGLFPVAGRLQRALFDLIGFKAQGCEDQRPWLRHHSWPKDAYPLRCDFVAIDYPCHEADDYPFVKVGGAGVHEMGVGPVHAGIIEPGHFRFQVVGEHILRLEERFGYAHKGIDKHFQGASIEKGARLSARISGDSTVAYSWAYSMALENAHHVKVPKRSIWLRALLLERERIANHLSDLGAIAQDAGLNFASPQFSRLKENMLRLNDELFNHRYLMDLIIPGGITIDITQKRVAILKNEILKVKVEVDKLCNIFHDHGGLQDRFALTGTINPNLAIQLGLIGLSARASWRQIDWRKQMTHEPYDQLEINYPFESTGDVAARVLLRFKEIAESFRMMGQILEKLPVGEIQIALPKSSGLHKGFGCVEGWRGPVFAGVCTQDEQLLWGHMHDPSWQNWLALEYAVIGNIVPDFPLINKSFNLSYSGHDS